MIDLGFCACADPDDYQSGVVCRVHVAELLENTIGFGCQCERHVLSRLTSVWRLGR